MFRLKELRKESGLKRSDFAKSINLPQSTVANYENETRQAPYELLILFANYFNVTIDYLLGRTNDFEVNQDYNLTNQSPLNTAEKELITDFRKCSVTGKCRILEYTKIIKDNI